MIIDCPATATRPWWSFRYWWYIENDSPESESDVEEHCDLTEKLAKWTVENNCTWSSKNQLLQFLRESGHILSNVLGIYYKHLKLYLTEDKCNGT